MNKGREEKSTQRNQPRENWKEGAAVADVFWWCDQFMREPAEDGLGAAWLNQELFRP